MVSPFHRLLDATIDHLEGLQKEGVRHVPVSQEALAALARPPERSRTAGTAPARAPVKPEMPAPRQEPLHRAEAAPDRLAPIAAGLGHPSTPAPPPAPTPVPPVVPVVAEAPDRAKAVAELRSRVLVCQKCPHLAASRRNVVFGVGDIYSPLMFVGEAPGADEDQQGEPFVGLAGQLLTKIILAMGFTRETVYIANVLKCRPDTPGQTSGNRKPSAEEMNTCLPYLSEQIKLIQPKVMVALGATAVEGLFGLKGGITKLRGNFHTFQGIPVMLTYHPAYLLRNQAISEKRRVWEDMMAVLEKLGRPISEKQRGYFTKPA